MTAVAVAAAAPTTELAHADAFCRRLARRHVENFTAVSALLPADVRIHLTRVYAFCRVTDDLGDESRSRARLQEWREAVVAAFREAPLPTHPVLLALRETAAVCAIPAQPFLDLIDANLRDQQVSRYRTWAELLDYCALSAAPVGRMVLAVLGIRGERAERLAADVCIGLQLANFAQDVTLDAALGRCYLPEEELAAGVPAAVRALCDRADQLLASGHELEAMTSGRVRAQLSLYRLGGSAIVSAVRGLSYRTDTARPRVTAPLRARLAVQTVALLGRPAEPAAGSAGGVDIISAGRLCQRLARRQAANFYWGFVALPRRQRTAIYALYDVARQVDDAVDGEGVVDPQTELAAVRTRLDRALAGDPDDAVMAVVARTVVAYRIPLCELHDLIEGVARDLTTHSYASWEELSEYCRLVASTVGRMCVRIFGFDSPVALELADDLGRAMQLTNILRDVRGDLQAGRVYLPADELAAFDIDVTQLAERQPPPGWAGFVSFQAGRARELFARGLEVDRHIPRRAGVCVRTMAGLYQRILSEIERHPQLPLQRRLSLPPSRKLAVLVGSAGRGLR
ncbi:MAG: phytoene/squalene synthase family protein [Candidatus Dormibacteria bacterium]